MENKKDLSIYIHIPFCKEKCFYCDFLSFKGKEDYFRDYQNVLLKEISDFAKENSFKYKVKTVFIGGGTPSVLPIGYIGEIMETLFESFNISENSEITIEANPGVLSYNLIKHFKESGINRISLGLQAWQNNILKDIGRLHNIDQFINNFENIRKVGFKNVNVDLMFSLPNQTLKNFIETLQNIVMLQPEHISCYSLILEEETKFYDMYKKGDLALPSDDLDREFYYTAIDILTKNDYNMYEISNFSKVGKECKHNLTYWKRGEYIGFGLGASSLIENKRISNTSNFTQYLNYINNKNIEIVSNKDMQSEFVFLGLRLTDGIRKSDFKKQFGVEIHKVYNEQISKFLKNGLLLEDEDKLYLSKRGIDLSNIVFSEFI